MREARACKPFGATSSGVGLLAQVLPQRRPQHRGFTDHVDRVIRLPLPDSRCAAMSRDRSQGVADDLRQLVGGLGGQTGVPWETDPAFETAVHHVFRTAGLGLGGYAA